MQTQYGQITYCTNIHPGESWKEHFEEIKKHIPEIKKAFAPDCDFGIGLRISNKASLSLSKEKELLELKEWLVKHHCYVFTINGFPYGGFHGQRVKDKVHEPDWTTNERIQYTCRLLRILASLLPQGMDGGISTSPLSYKLWFDKQPNKLKEATETATFNIMQVVEQMIRIKQQGGPLIHLDIEPEPDGILSNGEDFINWYNEYLLPIGISIVKDKCKVEEQQAEKWLRDHVRLCYDVCHFAVSFEDPDIIIPRLQKEGIKIGKFQISSAIKVKLSDDMEKRQQIKQALAAFKDSVYLHQVTAKNKNEELLIYPDLEPALEDINDPGILEMKVHFHIPVFNNEFGYLHSTSEDIQKVLFYQKEKLLTHHLEVETYTWEVLPEELKLNVAASIIRELDWVKQELGIN